MTRPTGIWRSLDEIAKNDEYRRFAEREFPALEAASSSRRDFMKLVGASLAAAGLISCRRDDTRILPYGEQPPEVVPGQPLYYASTFVLGGRAIGVLAETHVGRPIKLEGNPEHPASRGKLGALAQAAVLDLYDPDRSRHLTHKGELADWEQDFLPFWKAQREALRTANGGAGLAILSGRNASPAVEMLRDEIRNGLPQAKFYEYEPLELSDAGFDADYDLSKAEVIVSLDHDFLGVDEQSIRHTRDFSNRRGGEAGGEMNRLYVVEPHLTVTGSAADHRLSWRAGAVREVAAGLAALTGAFEGQVSNAFLKAAAEDLLAAGSRGVVLAGRRQSAQTHAFARAINERLKSRCVRYSGRDPKVGDIGALAAQLETGKIETLLMLGVNPVYDAPADLDFRGLLGKAGESIHLGLYRDETGQATTWHIPQAHWLESWGDARDGSVVSPIQPMIDPILGGRSELELLGLLAGRLTHDEYMQLDNPGNQPVGSAEPYEVVRERFTAFAKSSRDLGGQWRKYLNTGIAFAAAEERPAPPAPTPTRGEADDDSWEVCFAGSASTWDGRFANNGWLQETPDPITKLVWDNAVLIGPADARELRVKTGDVVRITVDGRSVDLPVFLVPGAAKHSVQVALGYGRKESGALGRHAGANAYKIRTSKAPGIATGAKIAKTGDHRPLASTQQHWTIEANEVIEGAMKDRAIVRTGTKAHFDEHPEFAKHMGLHGPVLQDSSPRPEFTGEYQWGMAIDLNRCTGCNACAVACQAENNIPIVGKDEVIQGREMAWIRIDRFFEGDPEGDVTVTHQPMLCQHCENAPCEIVCPVNATVHNEEGLNVMAYNRCVGTRYCANNCPYKVRRFNYYDYNKETLRSSETDFDGDPMPNPFAKGLSQPQAMQGPLDDLMRLQKNPDVTVRMRGVMEKCTFCTQRIQAAKIAEKTAAGQSKPERIADGELQTACQQSCPADAIVFGDIADSRTRVAKAREHQRGYHVLDHLNTRPRVTYLARIRNPNPALEGEGA